MNLLDRLAQRWSDPSDPLALSLGQPGGLLRQRVQAICGAWACLDGRWTLNFASANFLGFNCAGQPSSSPVGCISLGIPPLLGESWLAHEVEIRLAQLVGQQKALLFPSTTHAALDLLPKLAGSSGTIFLDEGAYPISWQGAAVSRTAGARIERFRHNDPEHLESRLATAGGEKVIVCDGVYPLENQIAPLSEFEQVARRYEASLYVDDAHGLGVLGAFPSVVRPWGSGGGGTPLYSGIPPGNLVHVGSLSKAFGVPLAFVAGPAAFIEKLRIHASSAAHSSPPSLLALRAALHALQLHQRLGEQQRKRLQENIRTFQRLLRHIGVRIDTCSQLPVQSLHYSTPERALMAAMHLRRKGFWMLLQLQANDNPQGGSIRVVLSAFHTFRQILSLVACLSSVR